MIHLIRPSLKFSGMSKGISAFVLLILASLQPSHAANGICVEPDDKMPLSAGCIHIKDLNAWLLDNPRDGADKNLGEFTLRFAKGIFRIATPIRIDANFAGNESAPVKIVGAGPKETIIRGSVPLFFSLAQRQAAGQGGERKTYVAKIPDQFFQESEKTAQRTFGSEFQPDVELYKNENRLNPARWPSSGYAKIKSARNNESNTVLSVEGLNLEKYAAENSLRIGGYFFHDWADEYFEAKLVSEAGGNYLSIPKPRYGAAAGGRVWIENAFSNLSAQGDWVVDWAAREIHLLSEANAVPQGITASLSRSAFEIRGVRNLEMTSLGIEEFRANGIELTYARGVKIANLHIRNVGSTGIKINGERIQLSGVSVSDTGGTGVSINGGNRKTLAAGEIVLRQSRITRVGRLQKAYKPAVFMVGVGNKLINNTFTEGPHSAIVFHGNNHLIEGNLIERFVLDTDDAGAIYTGQDWTERGTLIQNNVIRHIGMANSRYGANAIYLDDQASGITVRNNLIQKAGRGVLLGGGRDNVIEGNIFSYCKEGIYADARGVVRLEKHGQHGNSEYAKKLKNWSSHGSAHAEHYPKLKELEGDMPGYPKGNSLTGNIFFETPALIVKRPAEQWVSQTDAKTINASQNASLETILPSQLPASLNALRLQSPALGAGNEPKLIP